LLEWIALILLLVSMSILYWLMYRVIERQLKKIDEDEKAGRRYFTGVPPNTPWYNQPNVWLVTWLIIIIIMLIVAW
jgi:hypothetical protein